MTGSREERIAADFIVNQLAKFKISPVTSDGSYIQNFSLISPTLDTSSTIYSSNTQEYTANRYFFSPSHLITDTITSFSLYIPEKHLSSTPKFQSPNIILFSPTFLQINSILHQTRYHTSLLHSEPFNNIKNLFIVFTDSSHLQLWGKKIHSYAERLSDDFYIYSNTDSVKHNIIFISYQHARRLFSSDDFTSILTQYHSYPHLVTLTHPLYIQNKYRPHLLRTQNILGLIKGTSDSTIIIGAHYDHLGTDAEGNSFNGADDNASGISALLALAESLSKQSKPFNKNILFTFWSAEELGLLGSAYFTDYQPIIPLNKIITYINLDMIGRIDTRYQKSENANYVYVIGSDKITTRLDKELNLANTQSSNMILDYFYNAETHPMNIYRRSDQYNFLKHNIPTVFLFRGLHPDYHQITDDFEKINFDSISNISKLVYQLIINLSTTVKAK
ncbi:hypothetical protein CHS0354_023859 [Potamilus streckersoni]|uniref:Peptidase M28 domain-containing protein n=1 Tax=Potamilus streckersoni TaxID=2493646 RepID=A0AAE0RZA2_9BIVA|nr:hypothetical protein CHS0354_023859 [Potamilus streckersoni]